MRISTLAAAAALAFAGTSTAAFAADVTVGATVYGPEGNVVGTIASVDGDVAVLDTGNNQAPLGVDAFGEDENGLTITVTKAQIDQMVEAAMAEANAARDAALVSGAAVVDAEGAVVGTIGEIDGENVVLETEDGPVGLTRDLFVVNNGALTARVTAQQIKETLAASSGAAAEADTNS